jgi:uncharacterized membrane protein YgcG
VDPGFRERRDQGDHGAESRAGSDFPLVLTSLLLAGSLGAALAFPAQIGLVVDDAQLVPSAVERRVEEGLLDFQARSGITVSFAIVGTVAPLTVDEYARQLGEAGGATTAPDARAVVVVIDSDRDSVGVAVSDALEVELPRARRDDVVARAIQPQVDVDDEAAALELGAVEVRRALGDATIPPPVTTTTAPPAVTEDGDTVPWGAVLLGVLTILLLGGALVVLRRRRTWGHRGPVLWGTGWGRAVEDPRAAVHRRYRRVRDAVHVAEAETGMPLCFWLGPVAGSEIAALADTLFEQASVDGHAAALFMVAVRRPYAEVRVAPWARERLAGVVLDDLVQLPKVDALLAAAARITAGGGPTTEAPGGLGRAPRY